ncbi:unnamed protein product [Effrenium voratum]|uniref:Pentatricopeptide repeat-containing protein, chloroplastic n=1 Tax=Effrenium voratum TaxID=2562239 RepID=A0AA36IDQ5_9DINO|nr:unnamed protein product [Effrenium voratum]
MEKDGLQVVRAIQDSGWRAALLLADVQVPRRSRLYVLNAVISSCERSAAWAPALHVLGRIRRRGLQPDKISLGSALSSLGSDRSLWERGLHLLRETDVPLDVVIYNASISACAKGEQWQLSLQLLSELLDGELLPSTVTFGAAISACAAGGCWQLALVLLARLQEERLRSSNVHCSAAVHACTRGHSWPLALALYARAGAAMQLNQVTNNAYVLACGTASWRLALATNQLRPDTVTWNVMMAACASKGAWPTAASMAEDLRSKEGCLGAGAWGALAAVAKKCAKWQWSLELCQAMGSPNLLIYSSAIAACETTQWPMALHLLQELQRCHQADSIALAACADACGRAEQWEIALNLATEGHCALCGLRALAAAKRWAQLLAALQEMRGDRTEEAFSIAISACEKCNQWQQAVQLLADMPRYVRPDAFAFNAAISACEKGEQWPQCLSLLSSALSCGFAQALAFAPAALASPWQHAQGLLALRKRRLSPAQDFTVNAVLSACQKASAWRSACANFTPSLLPATSAMSAAGGRWQLAASLLAALQARTTVDEACYNAALITCEILSADWYRIARLTCIRLYMHQRVSMRLNADWRGSGRSSADPRRSARLSAE